MAWMEVHGIEELTNDFANFLSIPESVMAEMLNAEADIIVKAQRETMKKMWNGRYATGKTAKSIKKGKLTRLAKRTDLGGTETGCLILVRPTGENRKGERYGAVAFVNEYGKRGQPGRPAIRTAIEASEGKAVAAAEKIYNDYLDSKNL